MSEQTRKLPHPWLVLIFMLALYMLNYADRFVAVGLLEAIKDEFQVSDTFMAFLIGPSFAVLYTFLAIPIARLADRRNRVKIICAGAVVWSAFTIISGMAQTPWTFAFARLGVGVGEAAFLAPAFSVLADYFPPKRRAFAFAILNFGVYFGQIFGLVGGAQIAEMSSWRMAFYVLGLPGIVLAALTLWLVKEPERGRLDPVDATQVRAPTAGLSTTLTFRQTVSGLMQSRAFVLMTLGTALGGFASYGFGYWAPTLFARVFDLPITEANARYGGPSFVAGITGAVVLGLLCDKLAAKDGRWPFRLCAFGLLGFMATMLMLCFTNSVMFATLLTLPAGLMAGGWVIAMQSALQDLLPAKIRATATAIWAFALTFTGLVLGVQLVGVLNDVFAAQFGDEAIRYSLSVVLLAALPSAIFILMAGKAVATKDRELLAGIFS